MQLEDWQLRWLVEAFCSSGRVGGIPGSRLATSFTSSFNSSGSDRQTQPREQHPPLADLRLRAVSTAAVLPGAAGAGAGAGAAPPAAAADDVWPVVPTLEVREATQRSPGATASLVPRLDLGVATAVVAVDTEEESLAAAELENSRLTHGAGLGEMI